MRRLKGWLVTGEAIASIVTNGCQSLEGFAVVPATAKFVTTYFEPSCMSYVVVLEDASFDEVPEGCEIPLGFAGAISVSVKDLWVGCYHRTDEDYFLDVHRPDGSMCRVMVPREDSSDSHARQCMKDPDIVHGLNLVTDGHYS